MAHPYFHSISSVRQFGGKPDDYYHYHSWFDTTKQANVDAKHRLVLHNTTGIKLFLAIHGDSFVNSDNQNVQLIQIAQQHVKEDFGEIVGLEKIKSALVKSMHFNFDRINRLIPQKYGGTIADYIQFVHWLEAYNDLVMLSANSFGIFIAEQLIGNLWKNPTTNREYPTRYLAEKFVMIGYNGVIPNLPDVLDCFTMEKWMYVNAAALSILD